MLNEKYIYNFRKLDHFQAPVSVDGFLNDEEIAKVHEYATWFDPITSGVSQGETGELYAVNNDVRKGDIVFLPFSENMEWLFKKLRGAIDQFNNVYFRFNIVCLECFQYSIYKPGDHYGYHRDVFNHGVNVLYEQRKLSFTIQLSNSDDYEGGDLEFFNPSAPVKSNRNKGSITVFPSYQYHRVTPVTKGKRISLVGWIVGPDFQ